MLKDRDIVCIASANWDAMWVNAQHLMSRLSAHNRILYVNNPGLRAPGASSADLTKIVRRVVDWFSPPRHVNDRLHVISPFSLPFSRSALVRRLSTALLARQIRRRLRRLGMSRPILWSFLPTAADLVGKLGESGVIYQCVDDYSANPGVPSDALRTQEDRLERLADLVIVTSPALRDARERVGERLFFSPNTADVAFFRDAPPQMPDALAAMIEGRKVIGYHGNLSAYKTDIPLLERIARETPECVLLLVGPTGWGDPSTDVRGLLSLPNVLMPGRADSETLPSIVRAFDVGILPLRDNASTRSSFPMKFYEFMACGRPIVATDLPSFGEYRDRPDLCRLAATHEDFVTAVRDALANPGDEPVRTARVREAERHDWPERVECIGDRVEHALGHRRRKVALVHDWLTGMRGGERVLEVFCDLWPQADLFTLLHDRGAMSQTIESMPIRTSVAQRFPRVIDLYRYYLPLLPAAARSLDLSAYDLVISSSHCVVKSVVTRPDTCHISYVHTPMRYVWDMENEYFGPERIRNRFLRGGIRLVAAMLRWWDRKTAGRVDYYVSNSAFVRDRIRRAYGRDATVIHPPVDTDRFRPNGRPPGDFYLLVSAFAPYKKTELAIEAARRGGFRLKVVGSGQDEEATRKACVGTVEFLGRKTDEEIARLYADCRAFVFPAKEDFGITALEAQAAGRPVIAFGEGGALESVRGVRVGGAIEPDTTGVFFDEQTPESLLSAMRFVGANIDRFDPVAIRRHAESFSRERFAREIREFVLLKASEFTGRVS